MTIAALAEWLLWVPLSLGAILALGALLDGPDPRGDRRRRRELLGAWGVEIPRGAPETARETRRARMTASATETPERPPAQRARRGRSPLVLTSREPPFPPGPREAR